MCSMMVPDTSATYAGPCWPAAPAQWTWPVAPIVGRLHVHGRDPRVGHLGGCLDRKDCVRCHDLSDSSLQKHALSNQSVAAHQPPQERSPVPTCWQLAVHPARQRRSRLTLPAKVVAHAQSVSTPLHAGGRLLPLAGAVHLRSLVSQVAGSGPASPKAGPGSEQP